MRSTSLLCCSLLLALLLSSCLKDKTTYSADARLDTSVDTLKFDTVFTSTGSITQFVRIYNDNRDAVDLQSVRLAGGVQSMFSINVNGVQGPQVNDVKIYGEDSAYIFVTVRVNPNTANLPFIIRDSIELRYNGNVKWVQLQAYGQNAHFLKNKVVSGAEFWPNDLPYVILGGLTVNAGATLNIAKGCRIYAHADAPLLINGTLTAVGDTAQQDRIIFAGDRIDDPYRNYPAGWPGIVLGNTASNCLMQYVIVKNAYQAVSVVGLSATPKLTLNETQILNSYDAGLIGVNANIRSRNLLISNCGKNMQLVQGGNYVFQHLTDAAYSNAYILHREPACLITDYLLDNAGAVQSAPLSASFTNCIFWGQANGLVENEVSVVRRASQSFALQFDHVLWRVKDAPSPATLTAVINNIDPGFEDIEPGLFLFNYRLAAGSPALNAGVNTGVTVDLDGRTRPNGLPDLGAYEK